LVIPAYEFCSCINVGIPFLAAARKIRFLLRVLKSIDPDVKDEHQFDWLYLPKSFERGEIEEKIIQNLWEDCKQRSKTKFPGKECDYTEIYFRDEKIKGSLHFTPGS